VSVEIGLDPALRRALRAAAAAFIADLDAQEAAEAPRPIHERLDCREAAALLGISYDAVRARAAAGALGAVHRPGGARRVLLDLADVARSGGIPLDAAREALSRTRGRAA
jgi:hypothetical protein